jgi:hypothetical protein
VVNAFSRMEDEHPYFNSYLSWKEGEEKPLSAHFQRIRLPYLVISPKNNMMHDDIPSGGILKTF